MKIFLYSATAGLIITILLACTFENVKSDISDNVLRLHILANSDSEEDQALKLSVRNKITEQAAHIFEGAENRNDAIIIAQKKRDFIEDIAKAEIKRQGFDYDVTVEIGKSEFPYRKYENLLFPAGEYESVKVKIGAAEGQNWWCVMFPPLCFVDASLGNADEKSMAILKNSLSEESYLYMTKAPKIKFKAAEIFESIKTAFIK